MDYQEFEQYVADYVEGLVDQALKRRMDRARAENPELDKLARAHEQILAAFEDTPEETAPAGLTERILAEASVREQLLAAEQKAFRRGITLGVAAAAALAFGLAVVLWTVDFSVGAGTLGAANSWMTGTSNTLHSWLAALENALTHQINIPVVGREVPFYVLIISAAVTGVLAYFRDEVLDALDVFN